MVCTKTYFNWHIPFAGLSLGLDPDPFSPTLPQEDRVSLVCFGGLFTCQAEKGSEFRSPDDIWNHQPRGGAAASGPQRLCPEPLGTDEPSSGESSIPTAALGKEGT